MIYIKTNMTEMPKSCDECEYYGEWADFCEFTDLSIEQPIKTRPNWCPLVEIKENENDQTKTN